MATKVSKQDRQAQLVVRAGGRAQHAAAAQVTEAPADFAKATQLYGFEEVREQFVPEYNSLAVLYRHKKTGAEVMSLSNSDENKTFGIVLRTPVENSTGIPHILEHSVLNGSRKYPIKEPFVELIKGSLNTFLNAFTYPDRTCYPVASTNLQDFYNLVDVYLDAVFYPKCLEDPRIFLQEGWHYELEDPNKAVEYKGVVFNEMKGVYSQPDSVLGRDIQQALFPDNTYSVDSGGDPVDIPNLTYEQFKDFHSKFYHPSNARIWIYGDDDPNERLRILDTYLSAFDRRDVDSRVHAQKLWTEPRSVVNKYAVGDGTEATNYVSVNWLLSEDRFDVETELAIGFLDHLLLGTSASPLQKALNDSGLGEAIIGGGLEDELRQPTFSIGLKGVKEEDRQKVVDLVQSTLKQLAEEGFTQEAVEASVNTIEFALRENNTGRFPRGLSLMLRSMASWLYEKDPFEPLKWADSLDKFKARLASGEDIFRPLIKQYFLDNPHRVTVELEPDLSLGNEVEAKERARLDSFKETLDAKAIEELIQTTVTLKEWQETPNPPESLKCVPALKLDDIPKEAKSIPIDVQKAGDATLLRHDLFTNDILYTEVGLDMKTIPMDLLPLVPLFCRCMTQMGTDKMDLVQLSQLIGRKTGGISFYPFTSCRKGVEEPVAYIMMRGKAMADQVGDLFSIGSDVLRNARLDDKSRFKQMVLETKAGLESALLGSGHRVAASRLDAQRSIAGWVSESMGGVEYLHFIRGLVERVENDWDGVVNDLNKIRGALLQQKGTFVNMTADEKTLQASEENVRMFLDSLPAESCSAAGWNPRLNAVNEALLVPTQVNYVGKAANLYEDAGYKLHGSSYVINKYLGTTWLWDRIRVSGGAYGGFCDFDSHSGMFSYLSYRDPNLLKSLNNYDGTVDFLRSLEMDKEELHKSIIGAIGDVDSYQLPDAKGYTSLMRYLLDVSDEERQQRRDEILGTTQADFHAFADALEAVRGEHARIVVVTSKEDAAAAEAERPGLFDTTQSLSLIHI